MSNGFDLGKRIGGGEELDAAGTALHTASDAGAKSAGEGEFVAILDLPAGPDHGLPGASIGREAAGEQEFHLALAACGEEAGGQHAGVIKDKAIAGPEVLGEIAEVAVLPALFIFVEDEHARGGAVGEGFLGDALRRQAIMEVGD